jgi:hypothetical protein
MKTTIYFALTRLLRKISYYFEIASIKCDTRSKIFWVRAIAYSRYLSGNEKRQMMDEVGKCTIKSETRLEIISKIGFYFSNTHEHVQDGYWIIGMLSNTSMTYNELKKEIEKVKIEFPEYAHFFEKIS